MSRSLDTAETAGTPIPCRTLHAGYRNGVHRYALRPRRLRCARGRLPGGSAGPAGADRVGASREKPYLLCLATPLGRRVGRRDRSPSPQSPHHQGVEGVRSGEAELAQHGDAHSTTRRRKMLRPVLRPVLRVLPIIFRLS